MPNALRGAELVGLAGNSQDLRIDKGSYTHFLCIQIMFPLCNN